MPVTAGGCLISSCADGVMVAVPVTVNIVIGVEFVDYFSFRAQVAIDASAQF
jgi:hypothetical protein